MQNMEAVLAGIRVQKDRAMKDLSYARKEGNPTKIEEFQKKVALIDAQMKEIQEQFPKFKEQKKDDPGRKVNFSDVDAQLAELKNFAIGGGWIADKLVGQKYNTELDNDIINKSSYTKGVSSGVNQYGDYDKDDNGQLLTTQKSLDKLQSGSQDVNKGLNTPQDLDKEIAHNQKHDYVEGIADAGIAAAGVAGLYGLYKLYRHLKNKKNRTPEEEQKMQEAKGKLDAASKK